MSKSNEEIRQDRRRFLRNTAMTGAAIGLGAGASQVLAMEPDEGATQAAKSTEKKGYRATAHVNRYYERADW